MKKLSGLSIFLSVIFAGDKLNAQQDRITEQNEGAIDQVLVLGERIPLKTETDEQTKKLLDVPAVGNDPLAAIYTLPGVVQIPYSIVEGVDGPGIRGSSSEDNAYYIDFMPAGFVFHTFLGNSVFNENLVQKFDLKPVAFDASYGGAIGGVVDITLRDPRNQAFSTIFDWSMLQTGLTLESGVTDDSAFYVSYQESLLHLFIEEGEDEDDPGFIVNNVPRSQNYQAKYQWYLSESQRVTLSLNGAGEFAAVNIGEDSEDGRADPDSIGDAHIEVNYNGQGVLWEWFAQDQSSLSVSFARLNKFREFVYGDSQYQISKVMQDFLRAYYQTSLGRHKINYGVELTQHLFDFEYDAIPYYCGNHVQDCNEQRGERLAGRTGFTRTEQVIYLTDLWEPSDRLDIELGLRYEQKDYREETLALPRASIRWWAKPDLSLNFRLGRYARSPEDKFAVETLGNPDLRSPLSDHYLLGLRYHINAFWVLGVDTYYKAMSRLPLVLEPDNPGFDLRYSSDLSGNAQGVEILLEKERETADGWYGWASLSWSDSMRKNDLTGESAEYYLSTPWIFNLAVHNGNTSGWSFGVVYSVRSGQRYTPIVGIRENPYHEDNFLPVYGELNSKRLPAYQRLDVKAKYSFRAWGKAAAWTFALINASEENNVEGYYLLTDGNESLDHYSVEEETGMELFLALGFKLVF